MELSERKQQILKAVIAEYIRTAEPVGSKALSALPELAFSSATIRNEMSELEEMGYLEKPHTSAGRVPSHKGYRFYVDHLMHDASLSSASDETALMTLKSKELDRLIQEAGRLISSLTDYASVAVTPHLSRVSIRQFELIAVDETTYIIVIITDGNVVKNKLVHPSAPVTKEQAELLTYVLNQILTAIPVTQITAERFDVVRRAAGITPLIPPVAEFIAELIEDLGSQKVFLEGANKLLRFPEYHDTGKAQTLLAYMNDDKKHLIPMQKEIDGVQIFIGTENGENPLADTSTIYARYGIGEIGQGVIGIVGPTRMDYAALSARLAAFAKGLNKLIAETFYDENK